MKIKLGEQDGIAFLTVQPDSGEILAATQVPVLRAGLIKLHGQGKTQMVLDLTLCGGAMSPEVAESFLSLQGKIPNPETPMALLVAAPFGPVTTVGEGVEALRDGVHLHVLQLHQLRLRRDRLAALKDKSQSKLMTAHQDPVAVAVRDLKKRNASLRRECIILERTVSGLAAQFRSGTLGSNSAELDPLLEKRETARRIVAQALSEKKVFESLDAMGATGSGDSA